MRAVIINCTLKSSPSPSNTGELADVVADELRKRDVEVETIRVADRTIPPGVETDLGPGDDWPAVHQQLLNAEILIIGSPTWVGRPSSIAQRVIERMDAMISETDDSGRPVASAQTGRAMPSNLIGVASDLAANPLHPPPK